MIKFLLILVFLSDGVPTLKYYGRAHHAECMRSLQSIVESGIESGRVFLVAECYPVAPSWGLKL